MIYNKHTNIKLPKAVEDTLHYFESHDLWYLLSQNEESRSCRDAVQKRYRLGNRGIPLQDELKSFFGKYSKNGKIYNVVIHCRADQHLDWNKIKVKLQSESKIDRLTENELAQYFGFEYGTVNPFSLDPKFIRLPVQQLFDRSILENNLPPYTMMTNAGDLHWGIEFNPNELLKKIDFKLVADIIEDNNHVSRKQHKIGILTGNGPESGIKLWNDINKGIRNELTTRFSGDVSFPNVNVQSVPEMGLSMELEHREMQTWEYIKKVLISMCIDGCTIIALACNTTQYFKEKIENICHPFDTKLFSMEIAVDNYLTRHNIKTFDFLAIKYVTEFEKWSGFKELNKKYKIVLPKKEDINKINILGFQVKQKGVTGSNINKLRDLINQATSTNTVLIALTELSILLESQKKKSKSGKVFIDTLELLAKDIVDFYIEERYPAIDENID